MRSKSASTPSKSERKYITEEVFKRNYRYLQQNNRTQNFKHSLNNEEDEFFSRKPFTPQGNSKRNSINEKINISFLNTTVGISSHRDGVSSGKKTSTSHTNTRLNKSVHITRPQTSDFTNKDYDEGVIENQAPKSARSTTYQIVNFIRHGKTQDSSTKSIKGVPMAKQTPRDMYYKKKPCHDQRQFNNFYLERPKT